MSHIMSIKTEVRDSLAIAAACRRKALQCRGYWPTCQNSELALSRRLRHRQGRAPLRQLQRFLGTSGTPRPFSSGLCRGKNPHPGSQTRPHCCRATTVGWFDQGDRPSRSSLMKAFEMDLNLNEQTGVETDPFASGA